MRYFLFRRNKPTFQLAIKGLDLPDESESRLESEIHQLITREIDRVREEQIQESKKMSPNNNMNLIVSLKGLDLPEESKSRLESEIENVVRTYLAKSNHKSGTDIEGREGSCVCAGTRLPGITYNLPLSSKPTFSDMQKIWAIYFAEDILRLSVGYLGQSVNQNEMWISMESAPEVTWRKEIKGFNLCHGSRILLRTEGSNHGSRDITAKITRGCNGTDTLVFAKAKFLGVVTDMYSFESSKFWTVFGGCRLHFYWYRD